MNASKLEERVARAADRDGPTTMRSPLGIVVLILLVLILFGGFAGPRISPSWQYGYGYGTGGLGVVGVVLVIFLILWLLGFV